MFEFFIALFGGTYSVTKLLSEKSTYDRKKQESEIRSTIWTQRLHAWQTQVIDQAMQEDLWHYVIENKEAAWLAVQDAYTGMHFQKSYASMKEWEYDGVLDKTKAGKKLYRQHRFDEPLNIMLAKRGKLHSNISTFDFGHIDPGEGQRTRLEWDRTVEFWTYIRDELRRQGVDAKLLFEREQDRRQFGLHANKFFDIDDIEQFRYQAGWLTWLPYTWVGQNLLPL